jgi:Bax protein
MLNVSMLKIWSRRLILSALFAMVGGLYIAVATAEVTEKAETPAETPKEEAKEIEEIKISDSKHLEKVMKENDFKLDKSAQSEMQVPRTYVTNFPTDMRAVKDRKKKEKLFVGTLLPYILHENEIIKTERTHLLELKKAADSGKALKHADRFWLSKLCDKYKMKKVDYDELLRRADIIPPSLALGQAIIETGMGTSHAAIKKHSPFGMTVSQKVLAYKNIRESTAAYIRNLNSNNAYKSMRKKRAQLRKEGKPVDGNALIGDMIAYCEFKNYAGQVRSAIKQNDLNKYDDVSLKPKETA